MSSIRVLITNVPGFVSVESPTSLSGRGALYIRDTFISFLVGVNVTFITASDSSAPCSDDGLCSGELGDLQKGKGDYVRAQPMIKLKDLVVNLTTATTAWEYDCFLAYKKQMKVNLDYSTFFDFVHSFDWYFWILLLLLFSIMIVIISLTIKRHSPSLGLVNILWDQFGYTANYHCDNKSSVTRRSVVSVMLFSLLIIGILLSCSLQTGLISSVDFLKLETLEDILRYNYKSFVPFASSCRYEIENDISPIGKRIAERTDIVETMTPEVLYSINLRNKHVSVIDIITYILMKYRGCLANRNEEMKNPFCQSDSGVYNSFTVYLINRYNSPEVNSIIRKRTYAVFEKNIITQSVMIKVLRTSYDIPDAPQSCLDFKVDNQESAARISINYLSIPLISLLFSYFIGFCVLIVQKKFLVS